MIQSEYFFVYNPPPFPWHVKSSAEFKFHSTNPKKKQWSNFTLISWLSPIPKYSYGPCGQDWVARNSPRIMKMIWHPTDTRFLFWPETHLTTCRGSFRALALSRSRKWYQHGYGSTSNKFPEALAYQKHLFVRFSQGLYDGWAGKAKFP